MNVLSLFSGIGGLELGLERAGMTVAGQVEIDDYCRRVLAKHWPEVPRHDDVKTAVKWWQSEPRPRVDVVCGGFPCQPVSVAGRRRYQDDVRWLWPAMAAVIRDLRPSYAVMENVPGLLVRGMGDVLGDLAAIGYDAEWDCVPAAAVGAPHLRDRVYIVAYPQRVGVRDEPVTVSGLRDSPVADNDGTAQPVADTPSDRRRQGRSGRPAGHGENRQAERAEALADAYGASRGAPRGAGEAVYGPGAVERLGRRRSSIGQHWAAEPDVGRVAHGVPCRVDRLRALGNAVVPQVAEHIGQLIMANLTVAA